uniref:Uncharacterized protein n=1 Tax=Cacopsylla melanoneura TaxID=428564 RepID=A0A8D8WZR4_9HEMI
MLLRSNVYLRIVHPHIRDGHFLAMLRHLHEQTAQERSKVIVYENDLCQLQGGQSQHSGSRHHVFHSNMVVSSIHFHSFFSVSVHQDDNMLPIGADEVSFGFNREEVNHYCLTF